MEEEEGGEGGRTGGDVGDGVVGGDGDGIVGRRVGQGGCGSHVVFVLMMVGVVWMFSLWKKRSMGGSFYTVLIPYQVPPTSFC